MSIIKIDFFVWIKVWFEKWEKKIEENFTDQMLQVKER